jgi:hypothetical protein
VARSGGNVLIDSPRFAIPLLARIREMGGAHLLFLTHRDDVADHARWAAALGCERVLHARDVGSRTRDVERQIEGDAPVALADDPLVVPVPGHTAARPRSCTASASSSPVTICGGQRTARPAADVLANGGVVLTEKHAGFQRSHADAHSAVI